jgi:phosphatidylserine/phosphatidylglycerophosphate/cardiolipin synthase-like enzyme
MRIWIAASVMMLVSVLPANAGFEMIYNTPPTSNSIDAKVVAFIRAATSSIDVAIYAIDHSNIVDEIIAAKNRGVAVRMVVETDNWNASCDKIAAAGIPIVKDNAGGGGSGFMHNKFIIRDRNAVLTGSYNFTFTQTTNDKNSVIIVTNASTLAEKFRTEFNQMFTYKKFGTAKTVQSSFSTTVDSSKVEFYFSPRGGATTRLITAINTCNSNVWFGVFTFTDQGIADALKSLFALGRTVKGVFDRWQADGAYSKDEYMLSAGVPIRRDNYSGLLHDKTMAVDAGTTSDPLGIIGSFNFTGAANTTNDENLLIIHNATVANSIKANIVSVYNNKAS